MISGKAGHFLANPRGVARLAKGEAEAETSDYGFACSL